MSTNSITGRYAPSPTGRLHLGNLRTAWRATSVLRHVPFA
ncbi:MULTISPECIES: glutamate--tRNA ligase family protein [Corynebacterium]|nr:MULTISPECIES: glutamate--tRNA ligase family protein [Corynebacterium]